MKTRTIDLVLGISATAGAFLLSSRYWWHTTHWFESRSWSMVYLVISVALALFVLYAILTALHALARKVLGNTANVNAKELNWPVLVGVLGLIFALTLSGTVGVSKYRISGLNWFNGQGYPVVEQLGGVLVILGCELLIGAVLVVFDLLMSGHHAHVASTCKQRGAPPVTEIRSNYPATGWSRYLVNTERNDVLTAEMKNRYSATGWGGCVSGFEVGLWLLVLWLFGGVIVAGLLAFSVSTDTGGGSILPYVLGAVGCTGLFVTTILFTARFVASMHGWYACRQRMHNTKPYGRAVQGH